MGDLGGRAEPARASGTDLEGGVRWWTGAGGVWDHPGAAGAGGRGKGKERKDAAEPGALLSRPPGSAGNGGGIMKRLVEEVMQRQVITVTPETPVRELLRRMVAAEISGLPVVSEDGEILGVVSATDVIRLGAEAVEAPSPLPAWEPLALPGEDYDPESAAPYFLLPEEWSYPSGDPALQVQEGIFDRYTVGDIMTPAAFTVSSKDTVEDVARFLLRGRIHRALVVEGKRLVGIVTTFDLLRALVGEGEGD